MEKDEIRPIRRALISVSDKTGLVDFAKFLASLNVEIVSTGGTRAALANAGLEVRDVAELTQFPEIMGGRVKTLHPKVFGGILGRRNLLDDQAAMEQLDLPPIDLVVVNLYPFERTVALPETTEAEAIEQIDIGGPSLIRAAAKNHAFVTVATEPAHYPQIQDDIQQFGGTSRRLRRRLACECFLRTAEYDRAITDYLISQEFLGDSAIEATPSHLQNLPERFSLKATHHADLRYGENPHQRGAVYRWDHSVAASLVSARQLNGKELSFNNLLDLDSSLRMAISFDDPAAVIVKHNNPCGAACGETLAEACVKALAGDSLSAFGGVIGFNRNVDRATAEILCEPGLFIEAIVASDFDEEALELLRTRPKWRANVRLLALGESAQPERVLDFRCIRGGLLVQDADALPIDRSGWQVVTKRAVDPTQFSELAFAWEMVRHVKSNGIVLTHNRSLVGVGAGQMSRVDSVEIAIRKAGDRARGSVMASDAFFPFPDSIEKAAQAQVSVVIQPGGARNDADVIAACDASGIAMIFTHQRHFKH